MGRKRGVITTAVLCVNDKRNIKHPRLQLCIFSVASQNPQNIYDAGFQLSFSAVAGIAAAVPVMQEGWESRRLGRAQDFSGRLRRFGAGLWKNALASFGITLVMLPFLLAHYYAWSQWSRQRIWRSSR